MTPCGHPTNPCSRPSKSLFPVAGSYETTRSNGPLFDTPPDNQTLSPLGLQTTEVTHPHPASKFDSTCPDDDERTNGRRGSSGDCRAKAKSRSPSGLYLSLNCDPVTGL